LAQSRSIRVVEVLLVISIIVAASSGALVVASVYGSGPAIVIGSVVGYFPTGGEQLYVPVLVHNGGLLGVTGVSVQVSISTAAGQVLIMGSSPAFDVSSRTTKNVNVTLDAELRNLTPQAVGVLLTSDETLVLSASFVGDVPPLVGITGNVSGKLPWGAMMSGLVFRNPVLTPYNSTYSEVSWPFSFDNTNQFFRFVANMSGTVTDSAGNRVGSIPASSIVVKRGNAFDGNLTGLVLTSALPPTSGFLMANLVITGAQFNAALEVQAPG
jgi:hypothetical protein